MSVLDTSLSSFDDKVILNKFIDSNAYISRVENGFVQINAKWHREIDINSENLDAYMKLASLYKLIFEADLYIRYPMENAEIYVKDHDCSVEASLRHVTIKSLHYPLDDNQLEFSNGVSLADCKFFFNTIEGIVPEYWDCKFYCKNTQFYNKAERPQDFSCENLICNWRGSRDYTDLKKGFFENLRDRIKGREPVDLNRFVSNGKFFRFNKPVDPTRFVSNGRFFKFKGGVSSNHSRTAYK